MNATAEPVFVFGLNPVNDQVLAFTTIGEAQAFLGSYLSSEWLARKVFRAKVSQSHPVIYTITGQRLTLAKPSRWGGGNLVADGHPDDAELQTRLDSYASAQGLSVPVVDRVALANRLLREDWERTSSVPPPPLPRWLTRRMPPPRSKPPQID